MRHRALLLYLRREGLADSGGHVLHVAPERALQRWFRSLEAVQYTSADLESPLAAVHADITALPFREETFDLVLCSHVLEHVPDDRAAMRELHRVVRPGGTVVIQVPPSHLAETLEDASVTAPAERERLFGQYDHVRICGADYGQRLEQTGFAVEAVDYVAQLDPATQADHGLRTGEPFYVCVRPAVA
jgi:SAM-dependent methyltransferase